MSERRASARALAKLAAVVEARYQADRAATARLGARLSRLNAEAQKLEIAQARGYAGLSDLHPSLDGAPALPWRLWCERTRRSRLQEAARVAAELEQRKQELALSFGRREALSRLSK